MLGRWKPHGYRFFELVDLDVIVSVSYLVALWQGRIRTGQLASSVVSEVVHLASVSEGAVAGKFRKDLPSSWSSDSVSDSERFGKFPERLVNTGSAEGGLWVVDVDFEVKKLEIFF